MITRENIIFKKITIFLLISDFFIKIKKSINVMLNTGIKNWFKLVNTGQSLYGIKKS